MSDAGTYAALEAELLAALTTPAITGVVSLSGATSAADLAEDAVRKPAVGIVEGPAEDTDALATIGGKKRLARFNYEVAVVVSSARGKVPARATLRGILETVRDRVHHLSSSQPGPGRWRWKSDTPVEVTGDDLIAAVASFQIETTIGR